jgi:hypothetical protein
LAELLSIEVRVVAVVVERMRGYKGGGATLVL